MNKIRVLFLLSLFISLASNIFVYAQKLKPAQSKSKVSATQTKSAPTPIKPETSETQKHLTNTNIIQMVKGGFAESVILNAIQTNETQFDVSINALFELKNAGVSQKVIEAMQSAVGNKHQVQNPKPADSTPQQNLQPSRSETMISKSNSDVLGLPVYSSIKDIKSFNRIYINVENAQSRERIAKALGKAPQFQIVNDPNEAQIILEYKVLSRDNSSDTSDTDLRIKSQMNAVYIKDSKRVIAWSDTADHTRKTLGGIGWRSEHNEIKLTERFLKAMREQ